MDRNFKENGLFYRINFFQINGLNLNYRTSILILLMVSDSFIDLSNFNEGFWLEEITNDKKLFL